MTSQYQAQRLACADMLVQQLQGVIVAARNETDARTLLRRAEYARNLRDDLDSVMAAIINSGTCADIDALRTVTEPVSEIDASELLAFTR